MRKIGMILLFILMIFLCSCATQNKDTYTATYNNEEFYIDTVNQYILFKGQSYKYDINGGTITITYPNNSEYWRRQQGNISLGGSE